MIKYCHNKMNGEVDFVRFSRALSVSESFIHLAMEILENIGSIKILDVDKIEYVQSFDYEKFKEDSMYEVLYDEFQNIIEFKKNILNCEVSEIEEMIGQN